MCVACSVLILHDMIVLISGSSAKYKAPCYIVFSSLLLISSLSSFQKIFAAPRSDVP